ncbi:MAG: hypothetical protein U0230_14995 [Polyangiales bacterium]
MIGRPLRIVLCVLGSALLSIGLVVRAQDDFAAASVGGEGTADELLAFRYATEENFVKARELATKIVRRHPDSYLGHHVLALAQHYGEANFPVAYHEERLATRLFASRYGDPPRPGSPWLWHARMLLETASLQAELGMHEERLATLDRYNERYQPEQIAERAWSLMKVGRTEEARRVANLGLATNDPMQIEIALNALCAIEFEAGEDGRSYEACRQALEYGRSRGGPAVVDLTNFAESARTEFRLEESERFLLEATELDDIGYGNPWLELGELYLREARVPEAVDALRRVPEYRARRPANMRDSDRNEGRRVLAELFLLVGRPEDALRITDRALVSPDRRSHNSRDPDQDRAVVAMLDRAARLSVAESVVEKACAKPWYQRLVAWGRSVLLRAEAFRSGREVVTRLAEGDKLVGLLRLGTAKSGVTPPFLVSDLATILGPGTFRAALVRARRSDRRELGAGYYDAMEAEAWLAEGDPERAERSARRAIEKLPRAEAALVARVQGVLAAARLEAGKPATEALLAALGNDPTVFRRLGLALPVRLVVGRGSVAETIGDALERSPRLDTDGSSLRLEVQASRRTARACLYGPSRESLGCGEVTARAGEDETAFAQRAVDAFHQAVFAPRVDLSQSDIRSLDGSPRQSRDPVRGLLGPVGE